MHVFNAYDDLPRILIWQQMSLSRCLLMSLLSVHVFDDEHPIAIMHANFGCWQIWDHLVALMEPGERCFSYRIISFECGFLEWVEHREVCIAMAKESVRFPTMTTFSYLIRIIRIETHRFAPTTNCGNTTLLSMRSVDCNIYRYCVAMSDRSHWWKWTTCKLVSLAPTRDHCIALTANCLACLECCRLSSAYFVCCLSQIPSSRSALVLATSLIGDCSSTIKPSGVSAVSRCTVDGVHRCAFEQLLRQQFGFHQPANTSPNFIFSIIDSNVDRMQSSSPPISPKFRSHEANGNTRPESPAAYVHPGSSFPPSPVLNVYAVSDDTSFEQTMPPPHELDDTAARKWNRLCYQRQLLHDEVQRLQAEESESTADLFPFCRFTVGKETKLPGLTIANSSLLPGLLGIVPQFKRDAVIKRNTKLCNYPGVIMSEEEYVKFTNKYGVYTGVQCASLNTLLAEDSIWRRTRFHVSSIHSISIHLQSFNWR